VYIQSLSVEKHTNTIAIVRYKSAQRWCSLWIKNQTIFPGHLLQPLQHSYPSMSLAPIAHFSPEGSPLNKAYERLLGDGHRKMRWTIGKNKEFPKVLHQHLEHRTHSITTTSTITSSFPTTPLPLETKERNHPLNSMDPTSKRKPLLRICWNASVSTMIPKI